MFPKDACEYQVKKGSSVEFHKLCSKFFLAQSSHPVADTHTHVRECEIVRFAPLPRIVIPTYEKGEAAGMERGDGLEGDEGEGGHT